MTAHEVHEALRALPPGTMVLAGWRTGTGDTQRWLRTDDGFEVPEDGWAWVLARRHAKASVKAYSYRLATSFYPEGEMRQIRTLVITERVVVVEDPHKTALEMLIIHQQGIAVRRHAEKVWLKMTGNLSATEGEVP